MKTQRLAQLYFLIGLAGAFTSANSATAPVASSGSSAQTGQTAAASTYPAQAELVRTVVRNTMEEAHLKAVIVRVTMGGEEVITEAFGDSMTGVPATTDMHFRNGAVAISYVSTLLLELVDEKRVRLTDGVSNWLPDLPNGDRVSLGELAQMTAGYADYVQNPAMAEAFEANPFRVWNPEELIAFASPETLVYEPGTNWNYSHTDYVILGLALEKITGKPVAELLQEKVLGPLGLTNTTDPGSAAITEPALHAFSSERRAFLGVPVNMPFYEESSFWNPSWTITHGAIQTTDIHDLLDGTIAIGSGQLLSPASYQAMVSTDLRGKTTALPGCNSCFEQSIGYTYGLGIVITGNWLMQNPLFGGYAAVGAYLPSRKIAIAVAVTFGPEAFDADGNYVKISENGNMADLLFRRIGAQLAPSDAPPQRSSSRGHSRHAIPHLLAAPPYAGPARAIRRADPPR